MRTPGLAAHLQSLLAAEAWEAARLHLQAGAQAVRSRADGVLLGQVAREVPPHLWAEPGWARALAWAAYRAADLPLLRAVLASQPEGLEAFRAFLACTEGRPAEALPWAQAGLEGLDRAVAARYRAQALLRGGVPGWREAYAAALQAARGRDRALVQLDYAVALTSAGDDVAARPEFAAAAAELGGDLWGAAFAWSSLGIVCLRLGDLTGAERALTRAQVAARKETTGQHLVAVQLGLGGVYRGHGEYPRARHAFQQAARLAVRAEDRVVALTGEARTLALWGRVDEALAVMYDAAGQAGVLDPGGPPHRLFVEVAALRALLGDPAGARVALARAGTLRPDDRLLAGVVRAELLRREGQEARARAALEALAPGPLWAQEHARLFPALLGLIGVAPPQLPAWEAVVSTDGPVSVSMHGQTLPLRSSRPEAALLALLVSQGGSLGRERLQDALDLPGQSENARRKELSRAVASLRAVLGWPEAVQATGNTVSLSPDLRWTHRLPPPERADLFCEGRFDPWVHDWRLERMALTGSL